jgi:hypothetical protein
VEAKDVPIQTGKDPKTSQFKLGRIPRCRYSKWEGSEDVPIQTGKDSKTPQFKLGMTLTRHSSKWEGSDEVSIQTWKEIITILSQHCRTGKRSFRTVYYPALAFILSPD